MIQIHIKETHVDNKYGRIFEGWLSGENLSSFGDLAHTHCAMTSAQSIAYCATVEKWAYRLGVEVQRVFDFLPEVSS